MQDFGTKRGFSRLGRHGTLIASLAVVALASAGFAAAGGVEMVKGWFATVTVAVDGEVIVNEEVVFDDTGRAEVAVPPGAFEDGKEVSFTLGADAYPDNPGETGMVTVDLTAHGDVVEIQVTKEEADEKD